MLDLMVLGAVVALLVIAAVTEYRWAVRQERADQMHDAFARRMTKAETDDHTCDVCAKVSAVRELVRLYDDYALCCGGCAEVIKVQTALGRQERAR